MTELIIEGKNEKKENWYQDNLLVSISLHYKKLWAKYLSEPAKNLIEKMGNYS